MDCTNKQKTKMCFALIASQALFGPCEVVARALQKEKSTAVGALERVNMLQTQIKNLRTSDQL